MAYPGNLTAFIDAGLQRVRLRVNGTTIITDEAISSGSFVIDRYSSSAVALELGNVTSSQLTFTVDTSVQNVTLNRGDVIDGDIFVTDDFTDNLTDKGGNKLTDKSGNYLIAYDKVATVKIGKWYITNLVRGYNSVTVTCLDSMITLDGEADLRGVNYPITAKNFLNQIYRDGLGEVLVIDSSLYNPTLETPIIMTPLTYRQVLSRVCEVMGANAYYDWNGALHLGWYGRSSIQTIGDNIRVTSEKTENSYQITGVEIVDSADTSVAIEGNNIILRIVDNPFMTQVTQANRDIIAREILARVGNATYYGASANILPMPGLYPMDTVSFNPGLVPITHVTFGLNSNTKISADIGSDDNNYNFGLTKTIEKSIEKTSEVAKSYTDSVAQDTKTYTDTKTTEATNTAKNYTDNKSAETEANAKDYADGVASEAEQNAKDYTDTVEQEIKAYADEVAQQAVVDLTQEEVFNKLTQNGTKQGLLLDSETGDVYINATYMNTGTLTSVLIRDKTGNNYWNLETGDYRLGNYVERPEMNTAINTAVSGAIDDLAGVYYGTSSTAQNTKAKVVTCPEYTGLHVGDQISVRFTNANTAAAPTLNVNGTGAKSITAYGATLVAGSPYTWDAGAVVDFVYDGTSWAIQDATALKRLDALDDDLDSEGVFNRLTNNGQMQGIIRQNDELYINGQYIQAQTLSGSTIYGGVIVPRSGSGFRIDLDNGTIDLVGYATETEIQNLQDQIDGTRSTWTGTATPTLANEPAVNWTTTEEKNRHVGDVYYDTDDGYSYRFVESGGVYSWIQIQDSDAVEALRKANEALDEIASQDPVLVTDHVWNASKTQATFTAKVFKNGEDVTANYPTSWFTWYLRNEDYPYEQKLADGLTCIVQTSQLGYGSTVIGEFGTYDVSYLTNKSGAYLTDKGGNKLYAYTE